jgi:hypothetical protein
MHLMSACKANARLNGRDHVSISDVREMAPFVLRHRLIIPPGGPSPDEALQQVLDSIPAPVPTAVSSDATLAPPASAPAPAPAFDGDSLLLADAPPVTDTDPAGA